MSKKAFITSKGTVGYILQENKAIVDSIATMNKANAVLTINKLFQDHKDEMPADYAKEVLLSINKKRSAQDILIYLYNILLAQNGYNAIQTRS